MEFLMNPITIIKATLVVYFCNLIPGFASDLNSVSGEAVSALGTNNCPPVHSGYVFVGGDYVPPPYCVGRTGNYIEINGIAVEAFSVWPVNDATNSSLPVVTAPPPVPTSVTENSNRFDASVHKYIFDWLYYCVHEGITNRADVVIEAYEKLPCVVSAFKRNGGVAVVWKNGGDDGVTLNLGPETRFARMRKTPQDIASAISLGDRRMSTTARHLASGYYFFFPTAEDRHPTQFGKSPEEMFRIALPLIDAGKSAEEISAAVETQTGAPFPVSFCRALLNHKDSLDAAFRARIYGENPATTQAP
jgi:hypothetical protein